MAFFAQFVSDFWRLSMLRLMQNPEKSKACANAIVRENFFIHHAAFKQKKQVRDFLRLPA